MTFRGGNSQQGTWVHPEVAIDLAAWISVEFRILVNRWVREWMSKGINPVTPIVTQADPEMLTALAQLEQSMVSVRSHSRVMHNCLHSICHNQLSAVNTTLGQMQLLRRFAEGKYTNLDEWSGDNPQKQLEPEWDFELTPINPTDALGIPWNMEEYDIFEYYEELYPEHF